VLVENNHISDMVKHSKIKYEAFDEENGLLFKGRFVLELKTNS
jgi:hypothetical protein